LQVPLLLQLPEQQSPSLLQLARFSPQLAVQAGSPEQSPSLQSTEESQSSSTPLVQESSVPGGVRQSVAHEHESSPGSHQPSPQHDASAGSSTHWKSDFLSDFVQRESEQETGFSPSPSPQQKR
jgi:hypothetical protein